MPKPSILKNAASRLAALSIPRITNSRGTVYYGMHFYPGVAQYQDAGKDPYRVFLNEDTIRAMDPTFAGCPVFVHHVDGVEASADEMRKEADGWVIESFYNAADGKHWVKFVVVSDKGERAVKQGMRLSNCYVPKGTTSGGLWNGVPYQKEITGGEYEHLAIVPNPRYEESVIMTPDQFKAYNAEKTAELSRLANDEGEKPVLKFFKRTKVENSVDLTGLLVVLPKSGKEVSIETLVNAADMMAEKEAKGEMEMANGDHMVEYGGAKMSVNEMVGKHKALCDALDAFKKDKKGEHAEPDGDEVKENEDEFTPATPPQPVSGVNSDAKKNEEDEELKKKKKEDEDKKANALAEKKAKDKEKADALANANNAAPKVPDVRIDLTDDKVARGKSRYGA